LRFVRRLQDQGAEIGVHSYDHIDLKAIPPSEAAKQLVKAAEAFERYGLEACGFRCPYLSCNDELMDALPAGLFGYSSNAAIRWQLGSIGGNEPANVVFETIDKFYQPRESCSAVCVPWRRNGLVEIPVCVPDDLQIHDGLGLGPQGIADAWSQILGQTHERGELFTLIFHPELTEYCQQPFVDVLQEARNLKPRVWVARLRDIRDWWLEKSQFRSEISSTSKGLEISLTCSPRATILARGIDTGGEKEAWDRTYFRLETRTIKVPLEPRPFVGVSPSAPGQAVSFLQDQGYILDRGDSASRCAIYLADSDLSQMGTQVELIERIERSAGPLIRYGRWPNGAKSALSITGDLDALSLVDYLSRILAR
jgi:peptidoglycan/xylan/chitin deacetylase (PgdA/CDA1 family)